MDRDTRNAIQRASQNARALLEREVAEQLEGVYDIRIDGTIPPDPGAHLDETQRLTREKLIAAVNHYSALGRTRAEAVGDFHREAAFTILNRFVALKMLEARELVQECVSRSDQSSGFGEFCGLAPGLVQLSDHGYRLYLESIFDEIGQEVGILFDRRDPSSLVWPRRQALVELLDILNARQLAGVWGDDETIGWVYQYFNSAEERRQMRDESQAPRDSRELAVRNQYFTPRYVVRFLVDNTLGRTWWQIRGGDTRLAQICEFLVQDNGTELSRPTKDPRDIKILDPACGSGHFLLYAFDLLETIYEEAWHDNASPPSTATGSNLKQDYATFAQLRRALPQLILANNLFGVEIDPRAAQIAAFALWLRAQRAYRECDIPAAERPRITRTGIVVAEPMSGDEALIDTFARCLQPPLLAGVFRRMVCETRLAGELGPLLRIEDALATTLAKAREVFVREATTQHLPGLEPPRRQGELDFSEIDDARFFEEAEGILLKALHRFSESTSGGGGVRRWLFADDAAHGIALIELLRTRFDVVVMNPPFGEAPSSGAKLLAESYPDGRNDIYAAFVCRGLELAIQDAGYVGVISSRSFVTGRDLRDFRRRLLAEDRASLCLFLDLGGGVLDGAMVETAAYALGPNPAGVALFLDARRAPDKTACLRDTDSWRSLERARFRALPDSDFLYDLDHTEVENLLQSDSLEPTLGRVTKGLSTGDDFRFVRAVWEIRPKDVGTKWFIFSKGGEYSWLTSSLHLVVRRESDGEEMAAVAAQADGNVARTRQSSTYYGRPAITWSRRSQKGFSARRLRAGAVFSDKSPVIVPGPEHHDWLPSLPAVLASDEYLRLVQSHAKFGSYETGAVKKLPVPHFAALDHDRWWLTAYRHIDQVHRRDETSLLFVHPPERDWSLKDEVESAFGALRSGLKESNYGLAPDVDQRGVGAVVSRVDDFAFHASTFSWAMGVAFGRFDIRLAGENARGVADCGPFEPLHVCSPGMLTGDDGLPAGTPPGDYPISWPIDGVLVDEPGHQRDVIAAIEVVFDWVFGARADEVLREVAEGLDPNDGDIRKWVARSFFDEHMKRYSRSRRTAPIYWQLSTASGRYSVWLYAHRLTQDSLFRLHSEVLAPKLAYEERRLENRLHESGDSPSARQRREIEAQAGFVAELRAMLAEVKRVAPLWRPTLDDGIALVMAPLSQLVPHKAWRRELEKKWAELATGTHDWAELAMHLWPERVVPKCREDLSLAIAHRLKDVFWLEEEGGRLQPREEPTVPLSNLIRERTSAAAKDALLPLV